MSRDEETKQWKYEHQPNKMTDIEPSSKQVEALMKQLFGNNCVVKFEADNIEELADEFNDDDDDNILLPEDFLVGINTE